MLAVAGVLAAGCGGGGNAGGSGSSSGGGGGGNAAGSGSEYEQNGSGGNGGADEYEQNNGGELNVLIQRTNTMLGLSLECFTFYDAGLTELRHSGNQAVSDTGVFYGDENRGEIEWDSGRHSTYEWDGVHFRVDGAQGAVIDSCLGS